MEKTTRDLRGEAIQAWIDHTKDWDEHDYHYADPKDSFIEGAEWAWRKALREAEAAALSTPLTLNDIGYEAVVIADAIRGLIKEEA